MKRDNSGALRWLTLRAKVLRVHPRSAYSGEPQVVALGYLGWMLNSLYYEVALNCLQLVKGCVPVLVEVLRAWIPPGVGPQLIERQFHRGHFAVSSRS